MKKKFLASLLSFAMMLTTPMQVFAVDTDVSGDLDSSFGVVDCTYPVIDCADSGAGVTTVEFGMNGKFALEFGDISVSDLGEALYCEEIKVYVDVTENASLLAAAPSVKVQENTSSGDHCAVLSFKVNHTYGISDEDLAMRVRITALKSFERNNFAMAKGDTITSNDILFNASYHETVVYDKDMVIATTEVKDNAVIVDTSNLRDALAAESTDTATFYLGDTAAYTTQIAEDQKNLNMYYTTEVEDIFYEEYPELSFEAIQFKGNPKFVHPGELNFNAIGDADTAVYEVIDDNLVALEIAAYDPDAGVVTVAGIQSLASYLVASKSLLAMDEPENANSYAWYSVSAKEIVASAVIDSYSAGGFALCPVDDQNNAITEEAIEIDLDQLVLEGEGAQDIYIKNTQSNGIPVIRIIPSVTGEMTMSYPVDDENTVSLDLSVHTPEYKLVNNGSTILSRIGEDTEDDTLTMKVGESVDFQLVFFEHTECLKTSSSTHLEMEENNFVTLTFPAEEKIYDGTFTATAVTTEPVKVSYSNGHVVWDFQIEVVEDENTDTSETIEHIPGMLEILSPGAVYFTSFGQKVKLIVAIDEFFDISASTLLGEAMCNGEVKVYVDVVEGATLLKAAPTIKPYLVGDDISTAVIEPVLEFSTKHTYGIKAENLTMRIRITALTDSNLMGMRKGDTLTIDDILFKASYNVIRQYGKAMTITATQVKDNNVMVDASDLIHVLESKGTDTATFYFGDTASFTASICEAQKDLNMYYTTKVADEFSEEFPGVTFEAIQFKGTPAFVRKGTLTFNAIGDADTTVYEVTSEGLVELEIAKYDSVYDTITVEGINRLTSYVVASKQLEVREEPENTGNYVWYSISAEKAVTGATIDNYLAGWFAICPVDDEKNVLVEEAIEIDVNALVLEGEGAQDVYVKNTQSNGIPVIRITPSVTGEMTMSYAIDAENTVSLNLYAYAPEYKLVSNGNMILSRIGEDIETDTLIMAIGETIDFQLVFFEHAECLKTSSSTHLNMAENSAVTLTFPAEEKAYDGTFTAAAVTTEPVKVSYSNGHIVWDFQIEVVESKNDDTYIPIDCIYGTLGNLSPGTVNDVLFGRKAKYIVAIDNYYDNTASALLGEALYKGEVKVSIDVTEGDSLLKAAPTIKPYLVDDGIAAATIEPVLELSTKHTYGTTDENLSMRIRITALKDSELMGIRKGDTLTMDDILFKVYYNEFTPYGKAMTITPSYVSANKVIFKTSELITALEDMGTDTATFYFGETASFTTQIAADQIDLNMYYTTKVADEYYMEYPELDFDAIDFKGTPIFVHPGELTFNAIGDADTAVYEVTADGLVELEIAKYDSVYDVVTVAGINKLTSYVIASKPLGVREEPEDVEYVIASSYTGSGRIEAEVDAVVGIREHYHVCPLDAEGNVLLDEALKIEKDKVTIEGPGAEAVKESIWENGTSNGYHCLTFVPMETGELTITYQVKEGKEVTLKVNVEETLYRLRINGEQYVENGEIIELEIGDTVDVEISAGSPNWSFAAQILDSNRGPHMSTSDSEAVALSFAEESYNTSGRSSIVTITANKATAEPVTVVYDYDLDNILHYEFQVKVDYADYVWASSHTGSGRVETEVDAAVGLRYYYHVCPLDAEGNVLLDKAVTIEKDNVIIEGPGAEAVKESLWKNGFSNGYPCLAFIPEEAGELTITYPLGGEKEATLKVNAVDPVYMVSVDGYRYTESDMPIIELNAGETAEIAVYAGLTTRYSKQILDDETATYINASDAEAVTLSFAEDSYDDYGQSKLVSITANTVTTEPVAIVFDNGKHLHYEFQIKVNVKLEIETSVTTDIDYVVDGQKIIVDHSAAPCKIGYLDGENYTAIDAVKNADGTYSFTVPEGADKVVLVVSGDINGTAEVNSADRLLVARSLLLESHPAYKPLTPTQKLAADINNDGIVNSADRLLLARSLLLESHPAYQALAW